MRLLEKSKSIYEYGSYVYYETGSPAFLVAALLGCLFPGKIPDVTYPVPAVDTCRNSCCTCHHSDGWWFLLPGVVSVLLRLSSKEGQKAEGRKSPVSPFTPRAGQLSDIITGSPISLFMEELGSGKTKSIGKPLMEQYIRSGFAWFYL